VPAIWRTRSTALALLALVSLAPIGPAHAAPDAPGRTGPLVVPTGPLPEPESGATQPPVERVQKAAQALRERGFEELPILAWALLETARAEGRPELVEKAVELAPGSPGVRFEAARISGDPLEFLFALRALSTSLPGALFSLALAAVVLGGGALALAVGASAVAALRGFGLHGHAFGHTLAAKDPPGWPGVLLLLAALGSLPLFGIGPLTLAGAFGAIGALRLRRAEATFVAIALGIAGLALGPGLDRLSPALASVGREPALLAAYRIDRGQSLPGDFERVQAASQRAPDDAVFRLALATAWVRRGELARAEQTLGRPNGDPEPVLDAAEQNMRGIVRLAQGDLGQAIPAFEHAREAHESAAAEFNLSQAYGRALRLSDQQPAFDAARALDSDLVSRYMANEGANMHLYLIEPSLPLLLYGSRALSASEDSRALAAELRERLLGTVERDRLWMLLPAAGLLALFFRRTGVARCNRCDQPICIRCSREAMSAGTCMRCVRLFLRRERTDPRLRKLELDRDRRRQRRTILTHAAAALFAPGVVDLIDGRSVRGALLLFALGAGVAALHAPGILPVPWDLGTLGYALPVALALLFLAPTFAFGLKQTAGKLGQLRSRE
jgi:tetratricopeptide (TPR) repeat protein